MLPGLGRLSRLSRLGRPRAGRLLGRRRKQEVFRGRRRSFHGSVQRPSIKPQRRSEFCTPARLSEPISKCIFLGRSHRPRSPKVGDPREGVTRL